MPSRLWLLCVLGCACGKITRLPDGGDPRDVSGNYTVVYDNTYTLHFLTESGQVDVSQSGEGTASFGMYKGQSLTLDLAQFCAKPEVRCPTELLWAAVAIEQPSLEKNELALQELRVIDNTVHVRDAGLKAGSLSGLIDHGNADRFLLGLGAQAASSANCAAFDVSWAGGRFSHAGETVAMRMEYRDSFGRPCDPAAGVKPDGGAPDAGSAQTDGGVATCALRPVTSITHPFGSEVDGIKEGKVAMWWAGGCAFGAIGVGTTFVLETGFTAKRTGAFDPPPYTPAPIAVPDGGLLPDGGVP